MSRHGKQRKRIFARVKTIEDLRYSNRRSRDVGALVSSMQHTPDIEGGALVPTHVGWSLGEEEQAILAAEGSKSARRGVLQGDYWYNFTFSVLQRIKIGTHELECMLYGLTQ